MPGYRGKFVDEEMTKPKSEVPEAEQKLISEAITINNFNKVCRAIGAVQIIGTDCVDDTSTTILCKLLIPADQLEVGDIVIIGEGGANKRQWHKEIAVNDKLQFDDNDLIVGDTGFTNYNTIKDDLMLWIIAKSKIPKIITAAEILLTRGDKGLNDSNIPSKTTFAGSTKTIKEILEFLNASITAGGLFVETLYPNADGDKHEHYPATADNYLLCDDPESEPDDDTTKVSNWNPSIPLTPTPDSYHARISIKENTVQTDNEITLSNSWATFMQEFSVKPSDSLAWTKIDIQNLQIGFLSASYEIETPPVNKIDLYQIQATSIPDDAFIAKIEVYVRSKLGATFNPYFTQVYVKVYYYLDWLFFATKSGIQSSLYVAKDSTGSSNAYLLAIDPAISAYAKFQRFIFKANFGNTTACTLNVNSKGALAIKKWSAGSLVDLASGDIPNGSIAEVIHEGTYFLLLNIGKNEHTRAHDINSASDHNASGSGDKGKVTRANPSTGAIEFGSPDKSCCVIYALDDTTAVEIKEGIAYIPIPAKLNGFNLIRANAIVLTAGTTNATTFGVRNVTDSTEMLSANISIASGQKVGTAGTVNTSYDDVATNDVIAIDCDAVSVTAPLGLLIVLEFQLP